MTSIKDKNPIEIVIHLDYGYDKKVLNRAFNDISESLEENSDFDKRYVGANHPNTSSGILDTKDGEFKWTKLADNYDSFYWSIYKGKP